MLHSPLLTIYPFVIKNACYDIYYVNYFFLIMLSYTFLHGECPISFVCKKMMNAKYEPGEQIEDYEELYLVVPNKYFVNSYIQLMTCSYLSSLMYNPVYQCQKIHVCRAFLVLRLFFVHA